MLQKFAPLFGAFFLMSAGQAHATLASASAHAYINWSGLQVQLIDLAPNDGITPTLVWSGQSSSGNASSNNANPAASASASNSASPWSSSFGSSAGTPYADGGYSAGSNALHSGAVAHGNYATTPCPLPYFCFPQTNSANSSLSRAGSFTLTGKAVAIISLPWDIQANVNPGSGTTLPPYFYNPTSASASANFSANYITAGGTTVNASSNNYVGSQYYFDQFAPYTDGKSGTFSFAIYNDSGAALTGTLSASLSTSATAVLSPVPEAQTWGLMLAGLALLGLRLRRR